MIPNDVLADVFPSLVLPTAQTQFFDVGCVDIPGVRLCQVEKRSDERGWLAELWRSDNVGECGAPRPEMAYLSQTVPGAARGPHLHLAQTDTFVFGFERDARVVFLLFDLRRANLGIDIARSMVVSEGMPTRLVVPPGVAHMYFTGDILFSPGESQPATVLNMPNQLYRGKLAVDPVDEVRLEHLMPVSLWCRGLCLHRTMLPKDTAQAAESAS